MTPSYRMPPTISIRWSFVVVCGKGATIVTLGRRWKHTMLLALLFSAAGTTSARSQQNTTYSPSTPSTSSRSEYVRKMSAALEKRHLLQAIDSATRGMTYDEGVQFGASLTARGVGRLSPGMTLKWASLIDIALSRTDAATCSAWARGSSSPDVQGSGAMSLIGTLEGQEMDAWIDLSAEAMEAELRKRPTMAIAPDSAALEFVSGMLSELSSENSTRFLSDVRNLNIIDEAEACWVGRTMVAYATGAPEGLKEHRAQLLARLLSAQR